MALLLVLTGACGGEQAAAPAEESGSPTTTVIGSTPTAGTLPAPDAEWATQLIAAHDDFLAGDLDRNLDFVTAVDAEPDREVEHYVAYLRNLAEATSDLVETFPDIPDDGSPAASANALRNALTERRDALREAADDLEAVTDEVQAELDAGNDERYAEWRSLPAENPATDACFELQAELDATGLGLLRCVPGPTGDESAQRSTGAPDVDLGAEASPVVIELTFDDGDEPTGSFVVVDGDDALGCRAGTWEDLDVSEDWVELTKELMCEDGTIDGSFVVTQWFDGSNAWIVTDASGGFTDLAGAGTASFDERTATETMTGDVAR